MVLCSFIIGGIGGWFFTWYLIPKLNTVSWLVKYNLVPNSAPLVINTIKEVRVNQGADTVAAIQAVSPWVVGILSGTDLQNSSLAGSGIVLTSDGLVAATKAAVSAAMQSANFSAVENSQGSVALNLVLADGSVKQAEFLGADPASNLVFLKINNASGLSAASLGYSKDLQLGERVLALWPSLAPSQANDVIGNISSLDDEGMAGQLYSSDQIYSSFEVGGLDHSSIMNGSAIASLDNNIQGLYDNGKIISADTIRSAFEGLVQNQKVARLYLGLHYEYISQAAADLYYGGTQGVLVYGDKKTPAVVAASPAAKAGILDGDIITAIDGAPVNASSTFEDLLYKHSAGQSITFTILRGKSKFDIKAVLGQE